MSDRKELKSNDLAGWIEEKMAGGAQYIKPILAVVAVLFLVILTVLFIRSQKDKAAAKGWEEFMKAGGDTAALRTVAKTNKGNPVGLWALASRASNDLVDAAERMHVDRQEAKELVDSAIADLESVVKETTGRKNELVRAQALFSLGQAHELKFDVDGAKKYYDMLSVEGTQASIALVSLAKERSELLEDDSILKFYTWYATQSAPRPGRSIPPGMVPPVSDADLPRELTTLPSFPDLSIPKPAPQPEVEVSPDPPAPKKGDAPPAPKKGDAPPAPKKGDDPAPKKGDDPAPKKGDDPAPKKGDDPAPKKGDDPAPKKGDDPAPKKGDDPAPKKGDDPAPKKGDDPAPKKGDDPAPKKGDDPAPKKGDDPAPKKGDDPAPKKGDDPAPKKGDDPAPKKGDDPAPKKGDDPPPKKGDDPAPKKGDDPAPKSS